jgi:subtilisin family serine protease
VGFDTGVTGTGADRLAASVGAAPVATIGAGTTVLRVPPGRVPATVAALRASPGVRYAEPDALETLAGDPNDPSFGTQWGLENIGQQVNSISGKAGADVSAPAAWDVATGSPSVVVAELDSGVDYEHPDLGANVWTNPGGLGGCAAGTHGYNVLTGTCDPMDDFDHGTHVAGIIGAVGDNGIGVSGIDQVAVILPVKWTDATGHGTTSDLITAMDWVLQVQAAGVNVRVVNDSATFVGTAFSQALLDEINALGSANILFVTAAGNSNKNNDVVPRYPCNYGTTNELCVAASDQNDKRASFSNWGPNTVDLAAPGKNIYSTIPGGGYGLMDGSSMATPLVAGAAALVLSVEDLPVTDLKADILGAVDPLTSLAGKVRTGGRLNVCRALPGCVDQLVGNPGFEAATTGWVASGTKITLARTPGGHSGGWKGLASNTGASSSSCAVTDSPNWVTTTAAGIYHASVWLQPGVAGQKVNVRLRELRGSATIGEAITKATLAATDQWQQVSVDYTASQPGVTTLDFRIYGTSQPGTCFGMDDASLTLSPTG